MSKLSLLLLIPVAVWTLPGEVNQGQGSEQAAPAPDHSRLRGEIEQFQAVIESAVLGNSRGTILSSPKGAYLEDYGAVFSMEASLYRIRSITPFGRKPHTRKELDEAYQAMLQGVERLKKDVRRAVAEHGSLLRQLKPSDNLAVIVHLFTGISHPERPYPSQLIFKAKAGSISHDRRGEVTMEELIRQVHIIQF